MLRASFALFTSVCLLSISSCLEAAEERVGPADGRNIVVVVIDTLRADHLQAYGYNKSTAPFLESIAPRSVVFDSAYGASTWTAPSTASLFTSLYPKDHGVWTGLWTFDTVASLGFEVELNRIPPEAETMPEFMQSMGYRTFGFADNPNIAEAMGFARGFDFFAPGVDRGAPAVAEEVLAIRDQLKSDKRPSFLYLHLMDPHMPYERRDPHFDLGTTVGPLEFREDLANYDSEIGRVDAVLATLWDELGWGHDTLVIITSDHGEEFGDHGKNAHGPQLFNELLRVPMIVHGADENAALLFPPGRVAEPVCGIDLLPTLRGLLGADPSDNDRGVDLTGILEGGDSALGRLLFPERPMEFVASPFHVRAAIDGDFKLYSHSDEPVEHLFNMAVDPGEAKDIAGQEPEQFERLRDALGSHFAQNALHDRSYSPTIQIDEESAAELQKLGYSGNE